MELIQQALKGSTRAIARLITLVENQESGADEIMEKIFPHTGRAYIMGITGPPGSGKSTLVDRFALKLCEEGYSVGIIAIDPTSPFSGGAVLGDRLRMRNIDSHEKVFIRSVGTRGSLGGLSKATYNIVRILDACGKEFIIIETVGVGQDEVEIVSIADTTIIVLMPGAGDEIQTFKAGLMEIGDIFVVNKSDKDSAEKTALTLKSLLEQQSNNWIPPVVKTVATEGAGTDELIEKINLHRQYLSQSGKLWEQRKRRLQREIEKMVVEKVCSQIKEVISKNQSFSQMIEEVLLRKRNPDACVKELFNSFKKSL